MQHLKTAIDTALQKTVNNSSHAIVIGGSIAGLLAARVLADHFHLVTIVERDRFPSQPMPRPGVPQSHQVHVLLTLGQLILEQLFPGLKDELATHGAPTVDWTADFRWLLPGGFSPQFKSEITTRACTRYLLEFIIHQRLVNNYNVKFLEASPVTGLLANTDNTVITGVRVRDGDAKEIELSAQFVVDTSGRNSKTPQWLHTQGYQIPQQTKVNSFLGYASRLYKPLDNTSVDSLALYILPKAPDNPRGGGLFHVEGGRFLVNLIGVGGDYPPTDEASFFNFAQSLRSPEIYEVIKHSQPLSPIYGYQRPENCWNHYERLSRFPDNFVVLGDAFCAFNPIYGQGMTVAAQGALTLNQCLKQKKQSQGLGHRFQKQLAKVMTVPWLMATGDDFRWSTTQGKQPGLMTRLMHWYLDQIMLVAVHNAWVYKVLMEVTHLLKPPSALFHPAIMTQVLKQATNRRTKGM
jgi:2-polyprenyl-6-methoxyphenol hydroxylase-like FAD-dependent oxidoreductase